MAAVIILITVKCMDFLAVTWPRSLVSRAFLQLKQLPDHRVVMSSRVNGCSAGVPCNLNQVCFTRFRSEEKVEAWRLEKGKWSFTKIILHTSVSWFQFAYLRLCIQVYSQWNQLVDICKQKTRIHQQPDNNQDTCTHVRVIYVKYLRGWNQRNFKMFSVLICHHLNVGLICWLTDWLTDWLIS